MPAKWQIEGDYAEVCNCDFLCPCLPTHAAAEPTYGDCRVAQLYAVRRGRFDSVMLDGLSFVMLALTPGAMGKGGWTSGLIVDERAGAAEADALTRIGSGAEGGPPARWRALTTRFMGVERRPIRFESKGLERKVAAGELCEYEIAGIASLSRPGEALAIDNVGHPANTRLALGHARRARFNAFGIDWTHDAGRANGHFAPFSWAN